MILSLRSYVPTQPTFRVYVEDTIRVAPALDSVSMPVGEPRVVLRFSTHWLDDAALLHVRKAYDAEVPIVVDFGLSVVRVRIHDMVGAHPTKRVPGRPETQLTLERVA